jgi:hypothetical protein
MEDQQVICSRLEFNENIRIVGEWNSIYSPVTIVFIYETILKIARHSWTVSRQAWMARPSPAMTREY